MAEPEAADWVQRRGVGKGGLRALYAAALSTDGRFLAVGGGDRKVCVLCFCMLCVCFVCVRCVC